MKTLSSIIRKYLDEIKRELNDMLKEFPLDSMDGKIVSRWNFIDILNKFFYPILNCVIIQSNR